MNYEVRWHEPASTDLLAQLLRANDKPRMLAAAKEIERRLAENPQQEGESRGGTHRILFVRPFSVLFQVEEESSTVYIDEIKWVGS